MYAAANWSNISQILSQFAHISTCVSSSNIYVFFCFNHLFLVDNCNVILLCVVGTTEITHNNNVHVSSSLLLYTSHYWVYPPKNLPFPHSQKIWLTLLPNWTPRVGTGFALVNWMSIGHKCIMNFSYTWQAPADNTKSKKLLQLSASQIS